MVGIVLKVIFILAGLLLLMTAASPAAVFPFWETDAVGSRVSFTTVPQRVVCLAPYITEMLPAFGRESILVGLTRQDLILNSGLRAVNVGDYFSPDIEAIADCTPDLIIVAPSHETVIRAFRDRSDCRLMVMEAHSLETAFSHMETMGRIFDCEEEATAVIRDNRNQLALAARKLSAVPAGRRPRVCRVMAGKTLSCPGDDSFQNEVIAAAGGLVPAWGKTGFAVPVEPAAWHEFNPQVVYGCTDNETAVRTLLDGPEWKEVDAVRDGRILMFPCDLTCRVSVRVGAFVQWLAALLHPDIYSTPEKAVLENTVLSRKPAAVSFDYVDRAEVVAHRVADATYKSVVVRFKEPVTVHSTLEGGRTGIRAVGNSYVPMHASLGHMTRGIDTVRKSIASNLGYTGAEYAGLMTGADMANLSIQTRTFKELTVTALVTAGVRGNALRMSRDTGAYYEKPGTINIILLTNRRLSPAAMAWAVVTVTEAKSAALSELDIRSTYSPRAHGATGTGTDTVLVVQGEGAETAYTGGHTKIGELIAKVVHAGVTEAIARQNGIRTDRDLLQRLVERKLGPDKVAARYTTHMNEKVLASRLAELLQGPYYTAFMESALALSDAYGKGLVKNLDFFDDSCRSVSVRLSGDSNALPVCSDNEETLPVVLQKAFDAIVGGIVKGDAVP